MTISYPATMPSTQSFRTMRIFAEKAAQYAEAPFTYQQTVYERTGERWRLEVTYPSLKVDDAKEIIGFLLSLNGQVGTFLAGDPLAAMPKGNAGGTPTVDGDSQTGKVLATTGWSTSVTGILKAGDYISISNRLYMVTQDCNSDGSGDASVDIWPSIRQPAPANGTTITTASPRGLFRLDSNVVDWGASFERLYEVGFSAVEAL